MQSFRLGLVFTLSMVLSCGVWATPVKGLYEAKIRLSAEQTSQYTAYLPQALNVVLQKLTGVSDAISHPDIQGQLTSARQWVQSYSYQAVEEENPKQARILTIQFKPSAIAQLLKQTQLPIWGRERPLIMVWLAKEDNNTTALLGVDDDKQWVQGLRDGARAAGLPIELPLLDLEDVSKINFQDVRLGLTPKMAAASARYGAKIFLQVQFMRGLEDNWYTVWALHTPAGVQQWQYTGDEVNVLMQKGLSATATYLAKMYALQSNQTGDEKTISLTIENISTINAYARTLKYLRSLSSVSRVSVKAVTPERVTYQIALVSQRQALTQSLAADGRLKPIHSLESQDNHLIYRRVS